VKRLFDWKHHRIDRLQSIAFQPVVGRGEAHKMALGHPLEEPLKIYPVSDLVNSPKTDDARCIEPVQIDRDFFERQWWWDG
jgi:hypothetical protein